MRNAIIVLSFFFLLPVLFSCETTKTIYYFNDQVPSEQPLDSLVTFATHRIQCNDRISVTVSSTDPNLTAYLNPYGNVQNTQNSASGSGYLVNEQGSIEFPLLGKVQVKGLTTVEAATLIKEKLSYYYKDLFVNVNLSGKVYCIIGNNGISVPVSNERLTLFEALSQTGIQNPADARNDVWIVREDSGKRHFAKMDLTSKTIFESPYYYLKNNDFIYIKPAKVSALLSGNSPLKLIIATGLTLVTLLITLQRL